MNKIIVYLAVALTLLPASQQIAAEESASFQNSYQIQPGDVLEISVWREENMLQTVLVRPDGGLSYPLVGEINAAGKSVGELQTLVTERLSKYMPDPVVTVSTQQLSGNKIYVVGRVQRPGDGRRPGPERRRRDDALRGREQDQGAAAREWPVDGHSVQVWRDREGREPGAEYYPAERGCGTGALIY
jgi:hypothetical protein